MNTAKNIQVIVLCGHVFVTVLGIWLGVKLLDQMVIVCLTIEETARLFPKQLCYITFPPAEFEGSSSSRPH